MTEVAITEDSPSWLKQRQTVLNNDKAPKVVDKELARLKNIGAVSSVWTNKFVQEDNSGGRRPSYSSKSPSPTNESFNTRIRSSSGHKKIAEDISILHQSTDSRHRKQQSSISSRFSKNSISSLDLTEDTSRTSLESDMIVSPQLESIRSQYDECQALLVKANKQVEFYKQQLAEETEKKDELERTSKDEAAALWFQCETLKTQFAQIEAKLKRANADIEDYKRQLEGSDNTKDRVRQLVELVVKQETLLEEYEQLDLRQELLALKKQQEEMEHTISSLRADLEMSHGQMRLMLVVSTEIQDEFENFKETKENEVRALSSQHANDYEAQIRELKEALVAKDKVIADIQYQLRSQKMSMDAQMMELTESILEKDALLMEFMSSRNNSREIVTMHHNQQQQFHPLQQSQSTELRLVTTAVAPVNVTNSFYHPNYDEDEDDNITPRIQMAKVREFMYSATDSEEDDDSEVLVLSYSSDEDVAYQPRDYYQHLNELRQQSPTSSFGSSSEEEKIAEIKHFSYSSAQSQSTRPVSLNSTTESLSGGQQDFDALKEWPMPPPTPPPSEPLPPVPHEGKGIAPPPPRRERSRTIARSEQDTMAPIPPPRKAHLRLQQQAQRTSWMDDPEDLL